MHDEKRPGDVLKVPGDPLDDAADDARYGIYTFVTTAEKPPELAIADARRQLAEQGDLTSASIRYQQMVAESQLRYPVFQSVRAAKKDWHSAIKSFSSYIPQSPFFDGTSARARMDLRYLYMGQVSFGSSLKTLRSS